MAIVVPVFILVGLIILIGFLGLYLFKKTGIPDIAILLLIGLLIGPILKLVDPAIFIPISPLIAAIALTIILFDGGLNLNFYTFVQDSPRATLLAVLHVLVSMAITVAFAFFVFKWNLLSGLLLGAFIGGTSSSIVVPLVLKMNVHKKVSTTLGLESTFTDALTIVIGITLLQLIISPSGNGLYDVGRGIASAFSIGAVFGLIGGIIWLKALQFLKGETYNDIVTLAIVLLLYAASEGLGGNGAISSLIFGMVLGNGLIFTKFLRFKEEIGATEFMKKFHAQISFLIRTFFFVYLGLIITLTDFQLVAFSAALTVLLLVGRFVAVWFSSLGDKDLINSFGVMSVMVPRGLAAAVLSQLPIIYGIANAQMYPDIIFTVIISSVILTTIGVALLSRKPKTVVKPTENEES